MSRDVMAEVEAVLRHRAANGGKHLHHRHCIHNLPPEEQVTLRGRTVEWWLALVGPLPEQITPEQWECEPPITPVPSEDPEGQEQQ